MHLIVYFWIDTIIIIFVRPEASELPKKIMCFKVFIDPDPVLILQGIRIQR